MIPSGLMRMRKIFYTSGAVVGEARSTLAAGASEDYAAAEIVAMNDSPAQAIEIRLCGTKIR